MFSPEERQEIPDQSEPEDFDDLVDQFFLNFTPSDSDNSFNVNDTPPTDPQLLQFSSYRLAVAYLSQQPFPISNLSQYAIVFPLNYWTYFPRAKTLDRVPCNLIKIS